LIAGDACKDFADDQLVMNVTDKFAQDWLRSGDGRAWLEANDMPRRPIFAPDRECTATDPHPVLQFTNLNDGSVISDASFPIQGVIKVDNGGFQSWRLEYGVGQDPSEWNLLAEGTNAFPDPSQIFKWDLSAITEKNITLRLYLTNTEDLYAERRVFVTLNVPTPTPTVTPTPTEFPPTISPTNIPPTAIPVTPTETFTPAPTVPTDTPVVVTPTP
jgi:hypothetical protein